MINNKGFAVSTVLYTLLIAFLMFLGVALAQFEISSGIIGKANDDLVNGTKFEVSQVKPSGYVYYFDSEGNKVTLDSGDDKKIISCISSSNTERESLGLNLENNKNFNYMNFQERYWYESDTIVRIKSRYGTKYWPKNFENASISTRDGFSFLIVPGNPSGNIEVTYEGNVLKFKDIKTGITSQITLTDICE